MCPLRWKDQSLINSHSGSSIRGILKTASQSNSGVTAIAYWCEQTEIPFSESLLLFKRENVLPTLSIQSVQSLGTCGRYVVYALSRFRECLLFHKPNTTDIGVAACAHFVYIAYKLFMVIKNIFCFPSRVIKHLGGLR